MKNIHILNMFIKNHHMVLMLVITNVKLVGEDISMNYTDIYKTDKITIYFNNSDILHSIMSDGSYYHGRYVESITVKELRAIIKSFNIKGGYKLNKSHLQDLITKQSRTMLSNLNIIHHELIKRKINRSRCIYCTLTGAEYRNFMICHNCYYGKKIFKMLCEYCNEKYYYEVSGQSCGYGMPHTEKVCDAHIPTEKRVKINSYNDVDVIIRPFNGYWKLLFSGKIRNSNLEEQKEMDTFSSHN